jgi:hypothetical protein
MILELPQVWYCGFFHDFRTVPQVLYCGFFHDFRTVPQVLYCVFFHDFRTVPHVWYCGSSMKETMKEATIPHLRDSSKIMKETTIPHLRDSSKIMKEATIPHLRNSSKIMKENKEVTEPRFLVVTLKSLLRKPSGYAEVITLEGFLA